MYFPMGFAMMKTPGVEIFLRRLNYTTNQVTRIA